MQLNQPIIRIRNLFSISLTALLLLFLTFFTSINISGQGNLLIMPRRVVFEGNKNSMELTLVNTGIDTAKYVVSMVQIRMKEEGAFEQISTPDSGQFFADKFLRFFPRSVSLAPNESQMVKIQVIRSEKLVPGEYRSHVYFRAVPKSKPLGEEDLIKDTTSGVSIKLQPIFGITIPVIIRIGENDTKVNLSDLGLEKVNDSTASFNMTFNRSGTMSVYGDITIDHVAPDHKITRLKTVKGIAVYTPLIHRKFSINLDNIKKVDLHSGKIIVVYTSPEDIKIAKLAQAEMILQ